MLQPTALAVYDPDAYENIPDCFRHSNNSWNILAWYIYENGGANVRLYPKQGVDCDYVWEVVQNKLISPHMKDFHKCALAAWILWSTFERYEYVYD